MTGWRAVMRHELRLLLYAPLSYLFQAGFLIALSSAIFLVAGFYTTDEATLRLMAVFLPWVALILVPALAMRAWPDQHTDRSVELAMTLPVDPWGLVLGKFLAGYAVLLITLAFTTPFAATVMYLGKPDPGVMTATYLAAALLLGVYYALSLFAAALVREPIGAFVVGLGLLLFFLLMGWDVFGRLAEGLTPAGVIDALTLYSPYTWLMRMSEGRIEAAGLVLFLGLTLLALGGARVTVEARRGGNLHSEGRARRWALSFGAAAALVFAVPGATRIPATLDLTEAKEFTLHDGTVAIVTRLPEETEATLYWSAHEASVPANIKAHARRVRTTLRGMAALAEGNLTVREVDPEPDTEPELQALAQGLQRIPMTSGDTFFLGLTVTQGGRTARIPYLDIRREQLTEYDIALALNGLTRRTPPKVGVLSPLIKSEAALRNLEGFSFMAELKRAHDMAVIPFFKEALPEGLDVLIVIDASILRQEMLYAIDQFVMGGGGLIVMMDPHVRFSAASNAVAPAPSKEINDISDLLARYGITYKGESVVGDTSVASPVADRNQQQLSYPFWMRLRADNLSGAHATTASLNEVLLVEPGALEVSEKGTPLISTGETSGAVVRGKFSSLTPRELAGELKPDGETRVMAASVEGPLKSAFLHPPGAQSGLAATGTHKDRSTGSPLIFAVADVDWLVDPFSLQRTAIDGQVIVRPLNDNLAFLLNMVEYAGGDRALIDIRSRGQLQRPFTRVEALFEKAQTAFREEEARVAEQVAEVEAALARLPGQFRAEAPDQVPGDLKVRVDQLRRDLLTQRRELRSIRRKIREDVDALGDRLTVLNLTAGPALVAILWGLVGVRRRRRRSVS